MPSDNVQTISQNLITYNIVSHTIIRLAVCSNSINLLISLYFEARYLLF